MGKITVFFGSNGNTAVLDEEEEIPELQQSWFIIFMKFLETKRVDPTKVEYVMPDSKKATVFKTPDGYNWRIS